jgi:hypothetical protein
VDQAHDAYRTAYLPTHEQSLDHHTEFFAKVSGEPMRQALAEIIVRKSEL